MKKFSFKTMTPWLPGLTLFIIALIYLSYLPVNYDFDGTVFSQYLRYALVKDDLAAAHQPQHPLYIPVNYLVYKVLAKITGYHALEYFHLQLFSLCFSLLSLWIIYKISRQITGPDQPFFPIAAMALAAFTYGLWYYAVEAEVHMAGQFFVIMGIYLLIFKPGKQDTFSRTVWAAVCFTIAAGFHLTNGLIVFAVLIIFISQKKTPLKIFRFVGLYGFFLMLLLSLFALAYRVHLFTFYKNQLLGKDVQAGYKVSYWTGLSIDTLWDSFKSVANGFLVFASPTLSVLAIIFLSCGAIFIIYAAGKSRNKSYCELAAWMLPYFVFFTFWDHRNLEFKLNVVIPFIILLTASAAFLTGRRPTKNWLVPAKLALLMLIISIGLLNFYFYMKPAGRLENNRNYLAAEAVAKVTPPQSVIVIAGCGDDLSIHNKIYISYFANRQVFILDWMLGKGMNLDDIRIRLEQEKTRGNEVYFFSDTLEEGPALEQLLQNHHLKANTYALFLVKLDFKTKIFLIDGHYLSLMP